MATNLAVEDNVDSDGQVKIWHELEMGVSMLFSPKLWRFSSRVLYKLLRPLISLFRSRKPVQHAWAVNDYLVASTALFLFCLCLRKKSDVCWTAVGVGTSSLTAQSFAATPGGGAHHATAVVSAFWW